MPEFLSYLLGGAFIVFLVCVGLVIIGIVLAGLRAVIEDLFDIKVNVGAILVVAVTFSIVIGTTLYIWRPQ